MAAELQADHTTGRTVYFLLRNSVGAIWNGAAFEAYATGNYANYDIAATEQGTASGLYVANMPAVSAGLYNLVAKERAGGSPAESDVTIGEGEIEWTSTLVGLSALLVNGLLPSNVGAVLTEVATATWLVEMSQHNTPATYYADSKLNASSLTDVSLLFDIYWADIHFTRDQTNTKDEYEVTWYKNGVRQTTGLVTSPTIQVVKRADGTDLIASTAMTEIGTTGSFKKDESTNRLTAGEAALVIVAGTISGGSRSFTKMVGRDST